MYFMKSKEKYDGRMACQHGMVSIVTVMRIDVSELTAKQRPLPGSGE